MHALAEIEAVGVEALHARVEFEQRAAADARLVSEPIQKLGAKSARTLSRIGHEIVNVQCAPGKQFFVIAIACDRAHSAIRREIGEDETFRLHAPNAPDELGFDQLRAKLLHHLEAAGDVDVGLSARDCQECSLPLANDFLAGFFAECVSLSLPGSF